jgi:multicomponent Na+:H+ antiporter subunit F
MEMVLSTLALFLVGTWLVAVLQIWRGPTAPDRMLAPQLLGTTGIAVLLLVADAWREPALRDVALVLALLALLTSLSFAARWLGRGEASP